MKNFKSKFALLTSVVVLSATTVTAIAADYKTPAEIVAEITGRTEEDVIQERFDTGKTYGTIADEAGKLDEFKDEYLNIQEKILEEDVSNGVYLQEEADYILDSIQQRQAICNGTGYGYGCGYGRGAGNGYGRGAGNGYGCGQGVNAGRGFANPNCPYYN